MTKVEKFVYFPLLYLYGFFILSGCGGAQVSYMPTVGALTYPPVTPEKVIVFEEKPASGSYIELGKIEAMDELKCNLGTVFGEDKALKVIEKLRRQNPDKAGLSDITMLEILAEEGKIERGDICTVVSRFMRREEKIKFIEMALKGRNTKLMAVEAGEYGANAIMKIKTISWKMKGKPSSFGGDETQPPPIKVGVKTTAVAIRYEASKKGQEVAKVKEVAVLKKSQKEKRKTAATARVETRKREHKKLKEGKEKVPKTVEGKKLATEGAVGSLAKISTEVMKKPSPKKKPTTTSSGAIQPEKSRSAALAVQLKAKQEKLKNLLEEMKRKKKQMAKEMAELKAELSSLRKEVVKTKMLYARAKAEEERKKKEEARRAKIEARRKALEEKKRAEEEKKKKLLARKMEEGKAKQQKSLQVKEGAPGGVKDKVSADEEEKVKKARKEAIAKIKLHKKKIFGCLHKGGIKGTIKLTYLFSPEGKIDALGFEPDAPDSVRTCILDELKREIFSPVPKYYKAVFKYILKK